MNSKYETLPFLPETHLKQFAPGLSILQPLSRRGFGPGLIVLVSHSGTTNSSTLAIENGIPSPLMKWAEEGYTVVEIAEAAFDNESNPLSLAVAELAAHETTDGKDVGLIAYNPSLWNRVASNLASFPQIIGAAIYGDIIDGSSPTLEPASLPCLHHLAGKASGNLERTKNFTAYDYPSAKSFLFATPFQQDFHYPSESISHTRNLTFFKRHMNGPYFDLEAIWNEHVYYEFEKRSVECTMATMVQEPYVNHVPTLTGGIGRERLTAFYRDHFIFQNPPDTDTELISRSIGIDRVLDEFIFKCTHSSQIDWLLPGIPATGRKLEIPFTAVVNIRGDRLYHEHIAWDQSTVLIQLGLLPEYLPYPHQVPKPAGLGWAKRLEYRVPAAGVGTATKLRDKDAVESNGMFAFGVREV